MPTPPSRGKLLYHITHIDNFPSILEYGLMSRQSLLETENDFTDVANPDILSKREKNYSSVPCLEPKLSTSALVLIEIKHQLKKFDPLRLQKTAYFMNLFSPKKYFNFVPHKLGPYDHSIDIISKGIREFQQYHKTRSTEEAQKILYNKLISNSVNNTLKELFPQIQKACDFVNTINSNHELECLANYTGQGHKKIMF